MTEKPKTESLFIKVRNDALWVIRNLRRAPLNDVDFHDALWIIWHDYYEQKIKKLEAENSIQKKQLIAWKGGLLINEKDKEIVLSIKSDYEQRYADMKAENKDMKEKYKINGVDAIDRLMECRKQRRELEKKLEAVKRVNKTLNDSLALKVEELLDYKEGQVKAVVDRQVKQVRKELIEETDKKWLTGEQLIKMKKPDVKIMLNSDWQSLKNKEGA